METCVGAWQVWEGQMSVCKNVDRDTSFACTSAFQRFVLDYLLRACNDPVLFKHAHRTRFQTLVADFLVSFLVFQLAEYDQVHVLDEFVAAVNEAIFGEASNSHSPDALLSMLQVFQFPRLKCAASSAPPKMLLTTRTKMLRALSHALAGGFISASTLSLSALARVHCVFPVCSLIADDGEIMLQLLAWMKASTAIGKSSSALTALTSALQAYLNCEAKGNSEGALLSPPQLSRLLLFTAEVIRDSNAQPTDKHLGHQSNVKVVIRTPLSALLPTSLDFELHSTLLVLFVAKFEEQIQGTFG
ncbi:unnamed protein product [Peronospora belbahrii]|uniref:Uncharacterized protein n=1 Tax=Peronospora belbahrii TaxID=622444 RepID=A0AAU9L0L1_9STRA|nr:unnamed protein product [Peronospora belbahrii]